MPLFLPYKGPRGARLLPSPAPQLLHTAPIVQRPSQQFWAIISLFCLPGADKIIGTGGLSASLVDDMRECRPMYGTQGKLSLEFFPNMAWRAHGQPTSRKGRDV